MKFIATTALALLASSVSAASIRRAEGFRTVVLTNEQSGHSQAADIPTDEIPVSVPDTYPELYNPFHVDSVIISSGVVPGALCRLYGNTLDGTHVDLVEVNSEHNYAKFPQDVEVDPQSLKIFCV
ncbi:hypothetical protein BJX76DRAFT_360060 [Aspergillus varians]